MHVVSFVAGALTYAVFGAFFGLMVLGVGFMPEGPSKTFGMYFILLAPFFPTGVIIGRVAPSHAQWIAGAVCASALACFLTGANGPMSFVLRDAQPNSLVSIVQSLYQGLLYLAVCIPATWLGSKWRAALKRSNHSFNPDALKRAG